MVSFDTTGIPHCAIDYPFDIAEEISALEACGILNRTDCDPASWELRHGRHLESPEPDNTLKEQERT